MIPSFTTRILRAAIVGLLLLVATPLAAQQPVSEGAAVTETFVVDAVDYSARLVTLRDKNGYSETMLVGPEVQRLDAIKAGDKVTFRYYESIVYQIRKPGEAAATSAQTADIVREQGAKPGATISRQMKATVTVEEVDAKTPAVTIKADDGRRMSFKVDNRKNLENVKAGDRVEITYTQALAISVETPK